MRGFAAQSQSPWPAARGRARKGAGRGERVAQRFPMKKEEHTKKGRKPFGFRPFYRALSPRDQSFSELLDRYLATPSGDASMPWSPFCQPAGQTSPCSS